MLFWESTEILVVEFSHWLFEFWEVLLLWCLMLGDFWISSVECWFCNLDLNFGNNGEFPSSDISASLTSTIEQILIHEYLFDHQTLDLLIVDCKTTVLIM